jgi:hypothetical protein
MTISPKPRFFAMIPKPLLLLLLILAALLGNYLYLPLFFRVDFVFGSIFVYISLYFR